MIRHLVGAPAAALLLLLAGCSSGPTAAPTATGVPMPHVAGTTIGGVPLQPITAGQWRSCQQVANALRSPVPCPALLPVPMPGSENPIDCETGSMVPCGRPTITASGGTFFLTQQLFVVPAGYIGPTPGTGHVVIMAARKLDTRLDPTLPSEPIPGYCLPVAEDPPLAVHGSPASMYACGQDPGYSVPVSQQYIETVSGHELVAWVEDGVTCEVSFHGNTALNQVLAMTVANSTVMVRPTVG